jgi:hypothetical protein
MDARAARQAMRARLHELSRLIGSQSGVQTPEGLQNLKDWVVEADQLEEMLFFRPGEEV